MLLADDSSYQQPPKRVLEALNAPGTPQLSVSPAKKHGLLIEPARYPAIAELAEPMHRLAGVRLNPKTNGPHLAREAVKFTLMDIPSGDLKPVVTAAGAKLGLPRWSLDGSQFAFTITTDSAVELWVGLSATGAVKKIESAAHLNAMFGQAFRWMPDSKTILAYLVPAGRGPVPPAPAVPPGPKIQESSGHAAGIWTNPDALTSSYDEKLFDYFGTSQLAWIDVASGKATHYGKPAIYLNAVPSPDGAHMLVASVHRPYNYLLNAGSFPKEIEVWSRDGKSERKIASLPLEDRVPVDGVPTGPRNFTWRADKPGTLMWVEALDGGNPKEKVPNRDRVLALSAPFLGEPAEQLKVNERYMGTSFIDGTSTALITDYERNRRWIRTQLFDLEHPANPPTTIISRDSRDLYGDPGTPLGKLNASGQAVVIQSDGKLLMAGNGASPKGDMPFLNTIDLADQKISTLFQSSEDSFEDVVAVLDDKAAQFITRRESPTEPPNFFLHDGTSQKQLTHFTDPSPALRGIKRQLVTYKRPDGVPLSFTLYLPPNYTPGTRLPTVVWAYPLEYNDADTAGQINGSQKRFLSLVGPTHLFFLLQGYAILDNASMPVVGSIEKMNDTYIEQVVASAKAAIDTAAEMGVTDPDRVGVGGHSYGAFMTANLLANSDLFRAGIARSGAYNRTLTPFGFQSERRNLWEAPDTYLKMSPFMSAQKIKTPILLIHGEADNNQGTFPIQSERMYQAIRGNGGTIRYVVLPHEAHGYAARESVEHTLYEMISWFDKYVKNAQPGLSTNP